MAFPSQAGSAGVVLLRPGVHAESVAEGVEGELKKRTGEWRENKGLSTVSTINSEITQGSCCWPRLEERRLQNH